MKIIVTLGIIYLSEDVPIYVKHDDASKEI